MPEIQVKDKLITLEELGAAYDSISPENIGAVPIAPVRVDISLNVSGTVNRQMCKLLGKTLFVWALFTTSATVSHAAAVFSFDSSIKATQTTDIMIMQHGGNAYYFGVIAGNSSTVTLNSPNATLAAGTYLAMGVVGLI